MGMVHRVGPLSEVICFSPAWGSWQFRSASIRTGLGVDKNPLSSQGSLRGRVAMLLMFPHKKNNRQSRHTCMK